MSRQPIKCAHRYLLDKNVRHLTIKQLLDYMHSNGDYYDLMIDEFGLYRMQSEEVKKKVNNVIPFALSAFDDTTLYVTLFELQGTHRRIKYG